ncbi:MAG: N-acetylmuramoyl-L-alanine amidase [Roseburia sp.]|nr:N-acetylmuramoyl-L-alanine amidase [Roseburia sp.]
MQYRDEIRKNGERRRPKDRPERFDGAPDLQEKRRYEERRRRRRARVRRRRMIRLAVCLAIPVTVLAVLLTGRRVWLNREPENVPVMAYDVKYVAEAPDYTVDLLDYNEYSRPGTALQEVKGIVVHYTANPETTAKNNRDFFQGLKDSGETYASSHFIIGLEGEIIQCIPCNEIAYTSNERNIDTVSIECCIPDDTGKFADSTYQSLVRLVTWLMGRYNLTTDDVIRHYDVNGKNCPKYFVEHEDAWLAFKTDLLAYIEANGIAKEEEIR